MKPCLVTNLMICRYGENYKCFYDDECLLFFERILFLFLLILIRKQKLLDEIRNHLLIIFIVI